MVHSSVKTEFRLQNKLHESQMHCKKLHKSPDDTERTQSRSLLQMEDTDSDSDSTPLLVMWPSYEVITPLSNYCCHVLNVLTFFCCYLNVFTSMSSS